MKRNARQRRDRDDERAIIAIDAALLCRWPLPQPDDGDGKEGRGRLLVVAGSVDMPGSASLAVEAALRAGAGKVTLATEANIALPLAIALPEARVITTAALRDDDFDAGCVLIGPGMHEAPALVTRLLKRSRDVPVILDARAMNVLARPTRPLRDRILITPHAGELAHLGMGSRKAIEREPEQFARRAAQRWNVSVALKNAITYIAGADGSCWRHRGGNPGLGISGSGDVLAGVIGGLVARGASLEQAAVWGVALHARAGEALATRIGPLGYLARELPAQLPRLMAQAA